MFLRYPTTDKGLFELLPEDILKYWIATKLSYKDSLILSNTNISMYQFFKSLPDWSDTVIKINDTLKLADNIKPTSVEKTVANKFSCGITFVGSMGGFLAGGMGTLAISAILHVGSKWLMPLAIIGGTSGAAIGYAYTKLGFFAKENIAVREDEEFLLRSNIQEIANTCVMRRGEI